MQPPQPLGGFPSARDERKRGISRMPAAEPIMVPVPTRRTQTRDLLPSSVKSWATNILEFLPERDHIQVFESSITLAYLEAMHNQVLLTNQSGSTPFPFMQRGTFVDIPAIENLLPQYASGTDVGIDEADFIVIGPYNALYIKDETDPINNNQFADQLYVRNNDAGGDHTIICQVRVRFFLDQGGKGI